MILCRQPPSDAARPIASVGVAALIRVVLRAAFRALPPREPTPSLEKAPAKRCELLRRAHPSVWLRSRAHVLDTGKGRAK